MEDIIAYSIIAIFPLVVIFGAILLRRYFVRSREKKLTQLTQQREQVEKEARDRQSYQRQQNDLLFQARSEEAAQLRDRAERERIKGMQNVNPSYPNLGNAAAQNTSKNSRWRTLGGGGGTNTAQPVTSNSNDLFTGMAIGSLVNSLFSSPSYSKPSSDDSSSQQSSSSDSSSSWSDSSSSDSGPSSDW